MAWGMTRRKDDFDPAEKGKNLTIRHRFRHFGSWRIRENGFSLFTYGVWHAFKHLCYAFRGHFDWFFVTFDVWLIFGMVQILQSAY